MEVVNIAQTLTTIATNRLSTIATNPLFIRALESLFGPYLSEDAAVRRCPIIGPVLWRTDVDHHSAVAFEHRL